MARDETVADLLTPHPAAAVWPMLPEPDLRRLADDIAANGLRFPIVLDVEGLVLDGRNRQAACQIAGVEPEYETYDGDDPVGYILSANNERRHLSLPERAAATALTLALNGSRKDGRWDYGAVGRTDPKVDDRQNWSTYMARAGLVLDYLGEARLKRVADCKDALDAAVNQAKEEKARQARRKDLPDDLRALVDADELTVEDAERRDALSERYSKLVASGDLDLDGAEHLNERDEREHRDGIKRAASSVGAFVMVFKIAAHMRENPDRDEILAALDDFERKTFLQIEEDLWPSRTR